MTVNDCSDYIDVLRPSGEDPFPFRGPDGLIYLAFSSDGKVKAVRGKSVKDLSTTETTTLWTPPPTGPHSKELWAPELHYLHGAWYVYVAADDGENVNHRMYVLRCTAEDPFSLPWELVGKVADPETDRWAIDGTVLDHDGKLYFIWSGWPGDTNGQQNLYIAPMSDPLTISGPRVLISEPQLPWELNGNPLINEGPQVLQYNGNTHIIYSASGSWTDHYCLGRLTLQQGADPLTPGAWQKHPEAVFESGNGVVAPGHAGFVEDNGAHYIVYHAAKHPGAAWNRYLRAQKFTFNQNGEPDFGTPCPRAES
jgi:GH43 family beta-xylosidase